MRKVYLAAKFSRYIEMQEIAEWLKSYDYAVVSTWHSPEHLHINARKDPNGRGTVEERGEWAEKDLDDLYIADIIVSFTDGPHEVSRGGRHVEYGAGLVLDKLMIVVGDKEHIFHELADYHFPSKAEFFSAVSQGVI